MVLGQLSVKKKRNLHDIITEAVHSFLSFSHALYCICGDFYLEHQSNVRSENKQDKVMIEELETQIDDMAETLSTSELNINF